MIIHSIMRFMIKTTKLSRMTGLGSQTSEPIWMSEMVTMQRRLGMLMLLMPGTWMEEEAVELETQEMEAVVGEAVEDVEVVVAVATDIYLIWFELYFLQRG